jgi:hypothetical protein
MQFFFFGRIQKAVMSGEEGHTKFIGGAAFDTVSIFFSIVLHLNIKSS